MGALQGTCRVENQQLKELFGFLDNDVLLDQQLGGSLDLTENYWHRPHLDSSTMPIP